MSRFTLIHTTTSLKSNDLPTCPNTSAMKLTPARCPVDDVALILLAAAAALFAFVAFFIAEVAAVILFALTAFVAGAAAATLLAFMAVGEKTQEMVADPTTARRELQLRSRRSELIHTHTHFLTMLGACAQTC